MTRANAQSIDQTPRYADMFAAMGTDSRLISESGIAASALSHHLDELKNEGLVRVRRVGVLQLCPRRS